MHPCIHVGHVPMRAAGESWDEPLRACGAQCSCPVHPPRLPHADGGTDFVPRELPRLAADPCAYVLVAEAGAHDGVPRRVDGLGEHACMYAWGEHGHGLQRPRTCSCLLGHLAVAGSTGGASGSTACQQRGQHCCCCWYHLTHRVMMFHCGVPA